MSTDPTEDPDKPESLLRALTIKDLTAMEGTVIQGGMIPKTDACKLALALGAKNAIITNGTKPDYMLQAIKNKIFRKRNNNYTINYETKLSGNRPKTLSLPPLDASR
ncbi:MAG: hypothetical protein U5L09_17855 [Bacteroidales bacterium]|nr:hypothetical protein [Bacteroidales bacterium]